MFQTILSSIAVFLAAAYSLCLLRKKSLGFSSGLIVCALITGAALEVFDLLSITFPGNQLFWKKLSMAAEGLLVPFWILFSMVFAREPMPESFSTSQRLLILSSCLFAVAGIILSGFFYNPRPVGGSAVYLDYPGFLFYMTLLLFMIAGLVNLEATLVSSTHGSRYKIKYEILGAMSFLAVMLLYYSNGLLYRTVNMEIMPLRTFVFILSVGMMAYSRLVRGNGARIYVSRRMALRSLVLLSVGIYLVGLGVVGEVLKHFGDSFGRSSGMALAFLGGVGLIIIILSETARRKVKVFINRNFYRYKYDYKTQWLQFTDRLSGSKSDDDLMSSIVSGFTDVFGMACGSLFLYDDERKMFCMAVGREMEQIEREFGVNDPLISDLLNRQALVNLMGMDSGGFAGASEFFSRSGISFVIPLTVKGDLHGFVTIGRPINKNETYDVEDSELMVTLARQAASAILNLKLSNELSRAREMEVMGKLSAFVLHDLKNLVASLSMVVENARNYLEDPDFQKDMLDSLGGTVSKMNGLILRLKKFEGKGDLCMQRVDLLDLSGKTAAMISAGKVSVSGDPVFAEIDCEEIQKVILNLVINSIEASEGIEPIMVEVGSGEMAFIRVNDKGCGISDDFIKFHLFKPFKTTKKGGLGIGLFQCRQAVEAHGGRIDVASELGKGTTFTVWLPKV